MTALVNCSITTLPSHFKMQNINHTTRTNGITFLTLTENMCSSPVSCLSYTGTDDSCAVLRHSGVWCPSAGICCVPTNPMQNQFPAGKYFFSEVSNYPVNNRGVLALEIPQKTKPPQEERELYWILLQQEIAQAVQCHKQPLPSHNTSRKE